MNNYIRHSLFLTILIGMFIFVPTASAHRPEEGTDEGLTVIPSPSVSYAYYREFDHQNFVHSYAFDGVAGQFFHAGINIPQIAGLEDYGVTLALVGPGLPAIDEGAFSTSHSHSSGESEDHAHEQIQLPAWLDLNQLGGMVIPSQKGDDFFEPFTQTNYWGRQVLELDLPESGRYYLLVWSADKGPGKYVLDTGREEVFSPADLVRFPSWWLNTRLYFEQGPSLLGTASVLFFGIASVVFYRSRKKNNID